MTIGIDVQGLSGDGSPMTSTSLKEGADRTGEVSLISETSQIEKRVRIGGQAVN